MSTPDKSDKKSPQPSAVGAQPTTDTGYGVEGTNKTIPVPKEDAQTSEELLNTTTKHIEKSPYTRG